MNKPAHLKIWYLFWLVSLSLNSVLVAFHVDHVHQICAHGEITHDEEGAETPSTTRSSQLATFHRSHQHCVTSAWSRTAIRLEAPSENPTPRIVASSSVLLPTVTVAFTNIAITLQAPKNSPPFV